MLRRCAVVLSCLLWGCGDFRSEEARVSSYVEPGSKTTLGELRVVRVEGTPREVGLAYGRFLRDELLVTSRNLQGYERLVVRGLPWYFRPLTGLFKRYRVRRDLPLIPPEYVEEISAVAEGSGIDERDLLFINEGAGMMGCTSVLARGPGGVVHGRNFDFSPEFLGQNPLVFDYQYPGKNRVALFGTMGFLGLYTGVNDKGLSVSMNLPLGSVDESRTQGYGTPFRLRRVLENASTVGEAAAVLRSLPGETQGWIVTLASREEGTGAIFDMVGDDFVRSSLVGDRPLYALNHAFAPERAPAAVAERRRWVDAHALSYSLPRAEVIEPLLREHAPSSRAEMWELLSNTEAYGDTENPYGAINGRLTLQSYVFDTSGSTVWFSSASAYAPFARIYGYDMASSRLWVQREPLPAFFTGAFGETRLALERAGALTRGRPDRDDFLEAMATSHMSFPVVMHYKSVASSFRRVLPVERLLETLDANIRERPFMGVQWLAKAQILSGRDEKARLAALEGALSARLMPDELAEVLFSLAEGARRAGDGERARLFASRFLEHIDSQRPSWKISAQDEARYRQATVMVSGLR